MAWLGLDIGGANLKAANGRGWAKSAPFALWREPSGLAAALGSLIEAAPQYDRVAVTMTGELCDCFRTKGEGVRHILDAVENASADRDVSVYLVDGRIVPARAAIAAPELAAASNWHALARFVCRFVEGRPAILIDIGSTTTDLIPLENGQPAATALNDSRRLLAGELIYIGVGRTPVCAVVDSLPWGGSQCPVAAELFATTADAYVLLGDMQPQIDAAWTADGRPLTEEFARERLARMICADRTQFSAAAAIDAARAIRDAQHARLRAALTQVLARWSSQPDCFVISGSGEFLARQLIARTFPNVKIVSLAEQLGPSASECAPAHAVAVLAKESPRP